MHTSICTKVCIICVHILYMCAYIHMYAYIQICICANICIYAYKCICIYTFICITINIHTWDAVIGFSSRILVVQTNGSNNLYLSLPSLMLNIDQIGQGLVSTVLG